jgi:hypothetical protein
MAMKTLLWIVAGFWFSFALLFVFALAVAAKPASRDQSEIAKSTVQQTALRPARKSRWKFWKAARAS